MQICHGTLTYKDKVTNFRLVMMKTLPVNKKGQVRYTKVSEFSFAPPLTTWLKLGWI